MLLCGVKIMRSGHGNYRCALAGIEKNTLNLQLDLLMKTREAKWPMECDGPKFVRAAIDLSTNKMPNKINL